MGRRSLAPDAVFELCGDRRRRILLAVLADQERALTADDLTKAIVKQNHHAPLADVPGETVTRIKTSLHHVHVPKLEAAGLVEYDAERQLVEPTDRFDEIEPRLSAILEADPELAATPEL